ncbi:Formin 2 family protein [Entamoeba marina]
MTEDSFVFRTVKLPLRGDKLSSPFKKFDTTISKKNLSVIGNQSNQSNTQQTPSKSIKHGITAAELQSTKLSSLPPSTFIDEKFKEISALFDITPTETNELSYETKWLLLQRHSPDAAQSKLRNASFAVSSLRCEPTPALIESIILFIRNERWCSQFIEADGTTALVDSLIFALSGADRKGGAEMTRNSLRALRALAPYAEDKLSNEKLCVEILHCIDASLADERIKTEAILLLCSISTRKSGSEQILKALDKTKGKEARFHCLVSLFDSNKDISLTTAMVGMFSYIVNNASDIFTRCSRRAELTLAGFDKKCDGLKSTASLAMTKENADLMNQIGVYEKLRSTDDNQMKQRFEGIDSLEVDKSDNKIREKCAEAQADGFYLQLLREIEFMLAFDFTKNQTASIVQQKLLVATRFMRQLGLYSYENDSRIIEFNEHRIDVNALVDGATDCLAVTQLLEENAILKLSGGKKAIKIDDEEKEKLIQEKLEEMKQQSATLKEDEEKITMKLKEVEEKEKKIALLEDNQKTLDVLKVKYDELRIKHDNVLDAMKVISKNPEMVSKLNLVNGSLTFVGQNLDVVDTKEVEVLDKKKS